ncbi:unnamed protein product [Ilex paraguariensis]|uniref:Uncharacterized protein n=1 Tax=Ilex paraguariensis TaxID=185542 RepID=A0ABC8R1N0_9AQUA
MIVAYLLFPALWIGTPLCKFLLSGGDRSAETDSNLGDADDEIDNFPSVEAVDTEVDSKELPSSSSHVPPSADKGKGKVSEVGIPDSTAGMEAAFRHAALVGPNGVDPILMEALSARFDFYYSVHP